MSKRTLSYSRRQSGGIRWSRIFLLLAVCLGSAGAAWYSLRPSPPPNISSSGGGNRTADLSEYDTPSFSGGGGLLPGQVPNEQQKLPQGTADPVRQAVLGREHARPVEGNAAQPQTEKNEALAPSLPAKTGASGPFADKTLAQVTAEIATYRFIGNTPQEWGEQVTGITSSLTHVWPTRFRNTEGRFGATAQPTAPPVPNAAATVALTLDACSGKPGLSYDEKLIEFLRAEKIPATLFITSRWIKTNKAQFVALAADPLFEIAGHGTRHKPASIDGRSAYSIQGTASLSELIQEVEGNIREITAITGKRPRWFRAATAYYDEIAVTVIRLLHIGITGYSIACDEGATLPAARVAAKTLLAQDGDILLAHMNHPESGTAEGMITALSELKKRGYAFVLLSDPNAK